MKFKPGKPPSNKRKPFTVNLREEELELLKAWASQADIAPAELGKQMIEHMLMENRAEIIKKANYKMGETA
jgi:hypothetical protein